jgi:hypothetical protein
MTCVVPVTLALFIGLFLGLLISSICVMVSRSKDEDNQ